MNLEEIDLKSRVELRCIVCGVQMPDLKTGYEVAISRISGHCCCLGHYEEVIKAIQGEQIFEAIKKRRIKLEEA